MDSHRSGPRSTRDRIKYGYAASGRLESLARSLSKRLSVGSGATFTVKGRTIGIGSSYHTTQVMFDESYLQGIVIQVGRNVANPESFKDGDLKTVEELFST